MLTYWVIVLGWGGVGLEDRVRELVLVGRMCVVGGGE